MSEVKVAQSCQTLCDPTGILQARILEWVACPPLGDLPNPRIEPRFPALQADSLPAKPQGKSAFKWETIKNETISHIFETIFHIHHACMCKRHTYAEKGESRREGGIKQIQSLPEIVW